MEEKQQKLLKEVSADENGRITRQIRRIVEALKEIAEGIWGRNILVG